MPALPPQPCYESSLLRISLRINYYKIILFLTENEKYNKTQRKNKIKYNPTL